MTKHTEYFLIKFMSYFEVVLLSFIEGLTEFLPISSTGHLIIVSSWLGLKEEGFIKSFNIIIQFGAILSVLFIYWRKFIPCYLIPSKNQTQRLGQDQKQIQIRDIKNLYLKLFISFLPAALIGLLVKKKIDLILDNIHIVAWALFIGGIILILSDSFFKNNQTKGKTIKDLTWKECLILGFIQCFAFIPGVSRSAATILGGLFLKMDQKEAVEYSFFLAVPTLTGAAFIKTIGLFNIITQKQIPLLLLGVFLSFIFAVLAIRFFISWVTRFGFKHFGYYRIGLALIIFYGWFYNGF